VIWRYQKRTTPFRNTRAGGQLPPSAPPTERPLPDTVLILSSLCARLSKVSVRARLSKVLVKGVSPDQTVVFGVGEDAPVRGLEFLTACRRNGVRPVGAP